MISYLNGKIVLKKEKFIILDVNGVGYKVFLSKRSISKLPEIDKPLNLFCFQNVRENLIELYGFLSFEELEFFEILDDIRGVGPKAALEISSLGPLDKIKDRILKHDENVFSGIPGIGRKKAMAIILELSGKIKEVPKNQQNTIDETEMALLSLGFSKQAIKEALAKVPKNLKDPEQKIKEALHILGK